MKLTAYFFSVFIVSLNFVSSISTTTPTEAPVAGAPRVAHFPTHDPTLAPGLLGNITDYTEELNDKIQYYFGLTQMYMDQGTSYIAYISIASAVASIFFPFLGVRDVIISPHPFPRLSFEYYIM